MRFSSQHTCAIARSNLISVPSVSSVVQSLWL